MAAILETLASYVPALVVRRGSNRTYIPYAPETERFPAAIFFADISGFTRLTERLAQRGPEGAETLSAILNSYFGQLIQIITSHGGDVVKFAGDALLALWPTHLTEESLAEVTLRAGQCGLAVQQTLQNFQPEEEARLFIRVGIGAGEVFVAHLGGTPSNVNKETLPRWELQLSGDPLLQMSTAATVAQPGEVVLSKEAWALVKGNCTGTTLPDAYVRLETVKKPLPLTPFLMPVPAPSSEGVLRSYIPGTVLDRLSASQSGWLAELRRVTVLFIGLPNLDLGVPGALEKMQTVVQELQAAIYRFEGSINKLSIDDKGATLVAAFGLPPLAHEDDAARGAQAALLVRDKLKEKGYPTHVGVATGRAFCGLIGSDTRREYTMMGDVVNLSARLMQATEDGILCDTTTAQAAQANLNFETLSPVNVKGKTEPVPVFRPVGSIKRSERQQTSIIGRAAERAVLEAQILTLKSEGQGGVVIIEGEAGIGKSCLVQELKRRANELRVAVFSGAGDAIEKATPYYAWRTVFSQLFDLEVLSDQEARRRHILDLLELEPELLRFAPLLNTVLMLDLPENEITAQIAGQARADNTRNILLKSLQASTARSPKVLILEDAHWLDSASWSLALRASREVPNLLLVVAMRPVNDPVTQEFRQLIQTFDVKRLRLDTLAASDTTALLCQRLGVSYIPETVAKLIHDKAQGNPFFTEELAFALRDAGVLHIVDDECRVAPFAGDLSSLNLPDTVQGVITSRIDLLTAAEQLTLKTASVIGRVFAFRILHDVYPVDNEKSHLNENLLRMEQLELTPQESPEPDLSYIFKHVITQEVTYNLMLFSQRRQLHKAVAEWFEESHEDDLTPFYPLLAYHWSKAEVTPKALQYLEKAGEEALKGGSYQEAIRFFSEALALVDSEWSAVGVKKIDSRQSPDSRTAHWERQLGEAHYGLGNLAQSRVHLERTLALQGWPVPNTRSQITLSLAKQMGLQLLHRLRPRKFLASRENDNGILLEAARAYEGLGLIHYFDNATLPATHSVIHGLNLAELAGPTPELARLYANMCVAISVLGVSALAETYDRQAWKMAESLTQALGLAWVLQATGTYRLGVAQWERAANALGKAVEIYERFGDRRRWEESIALLSQVSQYQGKISEAAQTCDELYEKARRNEHQQAQAWALLGKASCALTAGNLEQAMATLEKAAVLLTEDLDKVDEIRFYGLLAAARIRRPEWQFAARQAARTAERLIDQSRPTAVYSYAGYTGVAEVYLQLWENELNDNTVKLEQAQNKENASSSKTSARNACKTLRRFASVFPVGQARAWLYQGWYLWLTGEKNKAQRAWNKSLNIAEKMGMPYEVGLAHLEIGRHATGAERERHLSKAQQIFTELGSSYELSRIEATKAVL